LLVTTVAGGRSRDDSILEELSALAISAGLDPVARHVFRRDRPHAALYLGPGQADQIAQSFDQHEAELVVFDNPLGPIQQRNLNQRWDIAVLDRTELILEIFSRRAKSREGQLQVELARLQHLSTRLVRGWTHLERQRGGIGGRGGPGEKQVELDRRMLDTRVKRLRKDLIQLRKQRANRRRARNRNGAFKISLVGYTNAGKSTLFNALTNAGAVAADQLFATLDTLTRQMYVPEIGQVMLSDTVGFVRDLPHSLVDAFKATLEETADADLLLHVIDGSSDNRREQTEQVLRVLREIGASDIPTIEVYNKSDQLEGQAPATDLTPQTAAESDPTQAPCDTIIRLSVSARTGVGIEDLVHAIASRIRQIRQNEENPLPSTDADNEWDPRQLPPGA
jgi:GTP-binding protein HflX